MSDSDEFRPRDHRHYEHHHDYRGWDRGPDRGPPANRFPDEWECGCRDEEDADDPTDFGFQRKFVSKAEMLEAYEWYLKELLNEAQGVREAIAELKAEMAQIDEDEQAMAEAEAAPKKARRGHKAGAKKTPSPA
jgi:hypothetical protein